MRRVILAATFMLGAAIIWLTFTHYVWRPALPKPVGERMFGTSVSPMDHDMSDTIVRNIYINGEWLGRAGTGGATVIGALALPSPWRPGLTAQVKWERCDRYDRRNPVPDSEACKWTQKTVLVHPFSRVGGTWLHVLENDEALIIPTMYFPDHADYPGPGFPKKNFFKKEDFK